jgi:hypothetical protein
VKNLGRFSVNAGPTCGNYSPGALERNFVTPAIKAKLKEMGANVADHIDVVERFWLDFFLGLLVIPVLLACANYTISGEAFLIPEEAINRLHDVTLISQAGEPLMGIILEQHAKETWLRLGSH